MIVATDIKAKRVLGVLKDDRLSTLEEFLKKIPAYKVRKVCIDMKEGFRKLAQRLFPESQRGSGPFSCHIDQQTDAWMRQGG